MERMGRELVRLCDSMERHGLVDYQMGVWEEEIINGTRPYSHENYTFDFGADQYAVLMECLDLLDSDDDPPALDTTIQAGPSAPGR